MSIQKESLVKLDPKVKVILESVMLSFLLILFPGMIVRFYSISQDFWISYLAYFLVVLLLINKFSIYKNTIFLSFILVIIVVYGITAIKISLPYSLPNILGTITACICAYFFSKAIKKTYKYAIAIFSLMVCIFFVFWGDAYWFHYYNFKNFTGRDKQPIAHSWHTYISANTPLNVDSIKGKLVLFEFFQTISVDYYFTRNQTFNDIYNKYKGNPDILIYGVDMLQKGQTPDSVLQFIRSRKYVFPILLMDKEDDLIKVFGVQQYFPTTIMLRNDTIIYRGAIEKESEKLDKVIKEELEK